MSQLLPIILVAAVIFGICYLVDKTFTKLFRSKAQHRSGMAVRANKRYGVFGVILSILGILAICVGVTDGPVLIWGGIIVLLMGVALAGYYLSFGIFYDSESILLQRFGRKDRGNHIPPDSVRSAGTRRRRQHPGRDTRRQKRTEH